MSEPTELTKPCSTNQQARRLKLLSYNIQVGIGSHGYRDYLTQSWSHILPDSRRQANLTEIAHWLSAYDIVALQEADAGSARTHFVNQVAYLAQKGGFPHWYCQQNRRFGRLAAHANGLLAKKPLEQIIYHKLPGKIAGRGALQASLCSQHHELLILSVHLALSKTARRKQLAYISELLQQSKYFIVMGDMNCAQEQVEQAFNRYDLKVCGNEVFQPTYPRWDPKHQLDQIWISDNLKVIHSEVIQLGVSDHLPIAMEIAFPPSSELSTSPSQTWIN